MSVLLVLIVFVKLADLLVVFWFMLCTLIVGFVNSLVLWLVGLVLVV